MADMKVSEDGHKQEWCGLGKKSDQNSNIETAIDPKIIMRLLVPNKRFSHNFPIL